MTEIIKPLIGVMCCHKMVENQPAQSVHAKYINYVNDNGGTPVLLPSVVSEPDNFASIVKVLDGLLLTGSYSNVAPERYGANHEEDYTDLARDGLSFKLLDFAKKQKMPVLAICRGLQEMNVAFGGSLHPDYREVGCYTEPHLPDSSLPINEQYQPAHDIIIDENSLLAGFGKAKFKVNSLHKQCINKVGEGVAVMAKAPDGLVEAIELTDHPYLVGVQWHPEFNFSQDELSLYLVKEFINHAQRYKQGHN
ncbi:gamma-glutamyl-gamma-aminobutyrate hydrolase family protein [Psychrobacter sp. HD31]|uniref:gamma-glutamyl-gamma-aminobutyrate hydrolase family protein n=1 Tax=Psychrobacter sp. HD31 TaxID=3112003 RepID=UPI003DA52534